MNAGMLKRILFGLLLTGFGLLFLASQLGMISIDWGDIFPTFWPVILIFVGLSGMASSGRNGSGLFWNGFVALIGVMFLLRNLDILYVDFGDIIRMAIPAAIILFGLKLIFQNGGSRREPEKPDPEPEPDHGYKYEYKYDYNESPPPPPPPLSVLDQREQQGERAEMADDKTRFRTEEAGWQGTGGAGGTAGWDGRAGAHAGGGSAGWNGNWSGGSWNGTETRSAFIGDLHIGRDYWELKPMNVSLFIGDTVIDLTKAQIPYGETKLTVSAFIGDVKVLVPNESDLSFKVNSSSFLGDIKVFGRQAGGFLRTVDEQLPDYADADKKINLQCNLFIGDIQIMRVG